MRAAIIALALVGTAHSVRADDTAPAPRSEDTAFWLSAGGEAASVALVGLGAAFYAGFSDDATDPPRLLKVPLHNWGSGLMTVGAVTSMFTPALGDWYAGRIWTRGLTLRTLGLVAFGAADVAAFSQQCIDPADFDCSPPSASAKQAEIGFIVAGAALFAAGTFDDIASTRSNVREYNRTHVRAVLVPTASPHALGLSLAGSF